MSQQELLKFVVSKLHELSVEFMLSGSHASSLQGEYRSTHDIDFVIDLTRVNITSRSTSIATTTAATI